MNKELEQNQTKQIEKSECKVVFWCSGCARKIQYFESERLTVFCSKCGKPLQKGYVA